MNRILKCRDANPGPRGGDKLATYIRAVEQSGRVRYHRIRLGRRAARLGSNAQPVTRLAYALCAISPDAAAEVLALSPREVGRVVKDMLHRARSRQSRRILLRRRPHSPVLRFGRRMARMVNRRRPDK